MFKTYSGECVVRKGNCFSCAKDGHKVRDFPNVRIQDKVSIQAYTSGPGSDSPRRNYFYALCSSGEQEEYPDVVMGMLQVFTIYVYALLDPVLLYYL